MAPPHTEEEDDPVTASYDIYLTPDTTASDLYLLQYPNRHRDRPYNLSSGAPPEGLRIKPDTGYLELDVNLNTQHNFNRYQGLKWGDALNTGRQVHNESGTYGVAAGFSAAKSGGTGGAAGKKVQDQAEREETLLNSLAAFDEAEKENRVLHTQTLGGQIAKHDSADEAGKPLYFVGAFRGEQLHLSKVTGTVQMRPQFHHIDAEDQRNKIQKSKSNTDGMDGAAKQEQGRALQQTFKQPALQGPKGELEEREENMRKHLQAAQEEQWTQLEYVDEDEEAAYATWSNRMFLKDVEGVPKLKSMMDGDEFLDAISAPGREGAHRRRKKKKATAEDEEMVDADG